MRNYRKLNSGLGLAVIASGALAIAACGASDAESTASPGARTEDDHGEEGGGHIEMTAAERNAKGIKSVRVSARKMSSELVVPGEITANRYKTAQVAPRISAQIVERHVVRGETVEAGAPLVTLSSVEMAGAQGALIISDQEWRRVRSLGRDVVSEKRYVEAEVASQQAQATLLSYGMAEREVAKLLKSGDASKATGQFVLFSPQDGTIVRDDFTMGEFVEAGALLIEISDESTVWVEARLTSEQSGQIAVGAPARVKSNAGHWEEGRVAQLQHALDETTRTLMARIEINNEDDDFHAGQFVDAAIEAGGGAEVLALPESAIVLMDGSPTVFKIDGDEIEPVRVVTGAASGGWIEVASGIAEGDEIVTEQTFLLKSLIQKTKMGEGHGH
ncbi:MAG: efflux RND transporter periplasmic adaptor subunit [Amphiplicatus sp.]